MSATSDIRALLDERGVEHYDGTEGTYWGGSVLARNGLNPVYRFSARESVGGLNVHLLRVTPEQAIEATLGRGLESENAELRELVRDMWSAYHDGATNKEFRALPDRMRELGVEV